MKILQALTAVLCLGTLSTVQAKTINLGTLDYGATETFDHLIGEGKSFGDQVKFRLDHISDLSGFFESASINFFSVELQKKITGGWDVVGSTFDSAFSFPDLSAGLYRFDVAGQSFLTEKGYWNGELVVAAVPEADTWLMLLIGAGLIGYQLRRKQRSLPAQSFATA